MADAVVDILIRARNQATGALQGAERSLKNTAERAKELSNLRTRNFEAGLKRIETINKRVSRGFKDSIRNSRALARVRLDTFRRNLTLAAKEMQNLARDARTAAERTAAMGEAATAVGARFIALGAAIAAPALIGIANFAKFEKVLARVGAITSGITENELRGLSEEAAKLGRTTEFTASQAASGLILLAQAGLDAREQLSALQGTLQLASAGQISLAAAADIATNVLQGLGKPVEELGRINDILAFTASNANTNVLELGAAFKAAAPAIAATGQSTEAAAAFLGVLANNGFKAQQAGTILRNTMIALAKDTGPAADKLRELGVVARNEEGNLKPLIGILEELRDKGLGFADAVRIFGRRTAVAAIATSSQAELVRELEAGITASDGFAAAVAEQQLDTFAGDVIRLSSAFDGLFLAIGAEIAPTLRPLVQTITNLVSSLAGLAKQFGPITKTVGLTTLAIGALVAGIGILLVLVGGTVVGIARLNVGLALLAETSLTSASAITFLGRAISVTTKLAGGILGAFALVSAGMLAGGAAVEFLEEKFDLFGTRVSETTQRIIALKDEFEKFRNTIEAISEEELNPNLLRQIEVLRAGIFTGRISADDAILAVKKFFAEQKRLNKLLVEQEQELAIIQSKQAEEVRRQKEEAAKLAKEEELRQENLKLQALKRSQSQQIRDLAKFAKDRVKIAKDTAQDLKDARADETSDVAGLQQQIRDIRREGFSEERKQVDIAREIAERLKEARFTALTATTKEEIAAAKANVAAVSALAGRLDNERKQVKALETAIDVRESITLREIAVIKLLEKEAVKASNAQTLAAQAALDQVKKDVPAQIELIRLLKEEIANIGKEKVEINFEAKIEGAETAIKRIKDQLESLNEIQIKVDVETSGGAQQNRLGGPIFPIRRKAGGKLPGFGGGDKVRALLEPGEFVIRKERVRQFGPLIAAINGARSGRLRRALPQMMTGGMVSAMPFQTGGLVPEGVDKDALPGGERVIDVVKLDISVGGREIGPVTGERSVVEELLDVLGKQGAALATG